MKKYLIILFFLLVFIAPQNVWASNEKITVDLFSKILEFTRLNKTEFVKVVLNSEPKSSIINKSVCNIYSIFSLNSSSSMCLK